MAEENQIVQNLPLDIDPNDPELAKKTYQIVIQLSQQVTDLRRKVAELNTRVFQ